MKKILITIFVLLGFISTNTFSLPNFWYSGVAYNASGQIVTTSPLATVEVSVTDGTNSMTQTINNVPVNAFGVFTVFINGAGLGSVNMLAGTRIMVKVNGITVAGESLTQWYVVNNILPAGGSTTDQTIDAWVNNQQSGRVELGTQSNGTTPRSAGTEFVVQDDGKVGIGTTTPGAQLEVKISNPASTSSVMNTTTNGIGSGITIQLTNASNGARGVDVLQAGVGPGVFATSAGGNAVWGITSSISAAGVIGDNTFGEAVVGRNRGGNGVGAVVGRNDSSGYGVRGFNTKNGIGVLGQTGISGGTGVGGRFENVNAANGNDALQAATNGTGWAGNFTNANNSSASRGVRISTTAGQGGNGLTVANGTIAISYQHPYASNTVIDDGILVVTTAGNVTVPTGPPLVDGATVWVVNNAGAVITVTNTTVGAYNVNPGRAVQLLFVSTVSGANWIPVQP